MCGSHLLAAVNDSGMNTQVCMSLLPVLLGIHSDAELLGHMIILLNNGWHH